MSFLLTWWLQMRTGARDGVQETIPKVVLKTIWLVVRLEWIRKRRMPGSLGIAGTRAALGIVLPGSPQDAQRVSGDGSVALSRPNPVS